MNRLSKWFAALLLTVGLCAVPAGAANQVERLTTDVALEQDGLAHVTQVFSAQTDEGTEFYMDRLTSGGLTYANFAVSDENGPYAAEEADSWDIDASFEEKAGRCGLLNIDGGVELCWGITDYGAHTYTVSYDIGGLAGGYSDADGLLYRFIDPDQSVFPTNADLIIRMADGTPLTQDNCGIWAFGFEGQIQFENGVIHAWTDSPLEGGQYLTAMVQLQSGLLQPQRVEEGSFQAVKDAAFQGSDYTEAADEPLTAMDIVWMVVSLAAICGGIFGIFALLRARKRAKAKKQLAKIDYFRDAPNGGDLNVSYALGLGLKVCTDESYLAARVLRLVTLGSLEPELEPGKKNRASMRFVREPHNGDPFDEALYTFLQAAAGADGVLRDSELEDFCWDDRHAKTLSDMLESSGHQGELTLSRTGCLKGNKCRRAKDLTPRGQQQRNELLGLKRYLLDFSQLAERDVKETFLWQEYMVYAALLGVAKQVMEQLRQLYPGQLAQVEQYQRYLQSTAHWNAYLAGAVERRRQETQAVRFGGGGGIASLGGGGGASGGGGMGTR